MNSQLYEDELRSGLAAAIEKLKRIDGFALYGFNIWTDPDDGVSEFSAETRRNSDQFVKETREWQASEAQNLRAGGRDDLADLIAKPIVRTDNPADFEYRGLVRIEHSDWEPSMDDVDRWDMVEEVLTRLRDEAVALIGRSVNVEPGAEVSIGTRNDWYDRPVPVVQQRGG
jgi:hypothetical protein